MNFLLTEEQREKLRKLDEEMETRRKNQHKKEETSKNTGIPVDIVDMDVIKIGIMLGLIKKTAPDGTRQSGSSLMDLIFDNDEAIDSSNVPAYYNIAPQTVREMNKIHHQQNHVQNQTMIFSQIVTSKIKTSIGLIRKHISFDIDEWSVENFVNTCHETMDVLIEELIDDENTDDCDDVWDSLQTIRNCLLGPINVCEYRKLLFDQIKKLSEARKSHKKIMTNLSLVDRRLSLYADSLTLDARSFSEDDATIFLRELQFRTYMRNPALTPFNLDEYVQSCCTPILLCVPIGIVLDISLVGPYMNNSLGFLPQPEYQHHSFYVLDNILSNGIRLWVIDIDLIQFCESLIRELVMYLIKIFRTFYKSCYFTNKYIPNYITNTQHPDVFENILKSLKYLCEKRNFHQHIKRIIISKSCIIPTEYDFFNYIETCQQLQTVYFEQFDKLLYESITEQLFDKPKNDE